MLMPDKDIYKHFSPCLEIQENTYNGNKVPSFGPSSYGYDIRLGTEFIYFYPTEKIMDPVKPEINYKKFKYDDYYDIKPGEFILAHSVEYVKVPMNVVGLVCDKSTYARCGIALQNTVLEPGWEGQITLEISNHNQCPVRLYVNGGIAQVLFIKSDDPCLVSYNQRNGKYMGQTGVTLSK